MSDCEGCETEQAPLASCWTELDFVRGVWMDVNEQK